MNTRILIVEDEAPIRQMLRMALGRAGYEVDEAEDASQARTLLVDSRPDLILLDWMMPGTSGMEFARSLKRSEETKDIPIVMLTARADVDDRVNGLDAGADDYLTKPFAPRELIARINAVLRRVNGVDQESEIIVEGLVLDPASHRVSADEAVVSLGPTEYRLLHFFMSHPERVYSRSQLLDQVWGGNVYVEERTVDVHIRRLRKALTPYGYEGLIQTVRGAGYRFSEKR